MSEQIISFKTAQLAKELKICIEGDYEYYSSKNKKLPQINDIIIQDDTVFIANIKDIEDYLTHNEVFTYTNCAETIRHNHPIWIAYSQTTLQKYLRENHLCIFAVDYYTHIDNEPIGKLKYQAFVNLFTNEFNEDFDKDAVDDCVTNGSDIWEEALEEGLYQGLLLLKNKIN